MKPSSSMCETKPHAKTKCGRILSRKPDDVVPRHKWRARIVWAGLLAAIFIYTVWQIVSVALRRANPSTSLTVSNDVYDFPYVLVCVFDGQGCGNVDGTTDSCISTALDYSTVLINGESDDEPVVQSMWTNCIGFDLSIIPVGSRDETQTYITIDMQWVSSDDASLEGNYAESVGVYLSEEEPTEDTLHFLEVPYSRNEGDTLELEYVATDLTIGKTTRKTLDGGSLTIFPALTISTTSVTLSNNYATTGSLDYAWGRLYMSVTQGPYSRTVVKDVDPLEVSAILGNIGGFWELLIIVWGLCFIAVNRNHEPQQKARDFKKSINKGAEIVTRRRSLSTSAASESIEARPTWEAAYRGDTSGYRPCGPPGGGGGHAVGGGESGNHGARLHNMGFRQQGNPALVSSSSGRPVALSHPRRTSGAPSSTSSGGDASQRGPPPGYTEHVQANAAT